nr:MAG TPA: GLUTAMATE DEHYDROGENASE [Caudoviricetes sp.]
MNAEKVLAALNEIIEQIDKDQLDYNFKKYFDRDMNSIESSHCGAQSMMADLCKALQMDILKSSDKCKANRVKAVLRILKNSEREQFTKAFIDDDGKEIVLDGYRAICFANPVDGVPTTDNGDGFVSIKNTYFSNDISSYDKLNLASLAELKAELKIDKANNVGIDTGKKKKTPIYAFGISANEYNSTMPVVNLQYLIDIVETMPTAKAFYKTNRNGILTVYFFDDEGNMAVLLPLRFNKDYKDVLSRKVVK